MQMGSPGVNIVTVNPSSDGIFRGNDITAVANECYRWFDEEGPLASNYSHVGIWNPGGSGVTLLLDRIGGSVASLADIQFRYLTAILADDDGAWPTLNVTGAAGVCHGCSEQNVALQGTLLAEVGAHGGDPYWLDMIFPLVCLPGSGICVSINVVNLKMEGVFFGREI